MAWCLVKAQGQLYLYLYIIVMKPKYGAVAMLPFTFFLNELLNNSCIFFKHPSCDNLRLYIKWYYCCPHLINLQVCHVTEKLLRWNDFHWHAILIEFHKYLSRTISTVGACNCISSQITDGQTQADLQELCSFGKLNTVEVKL
jgi:hypothetical protein